MRTAQGGRVGGREAHRVEVHHVPASARRIDPVAGQRRGLHGNLQRVAGLNGHGVTPRAACRDVEVLRSGRGCERAVGRLRDARFAAGGRVEAVRLVESGGDGPEPELALAGPQVAQRDVGAPRQRHGARLLHAAEPHARVVGRQHVEGLRALLPRQTVEFAPHGHGHAPLAGVVAHHHRVASVGRIFDPRQRRGRHDRGVECGAYSVLGAGLAVGQVEVAELRIDPLFEEQRAPVLGPPHAAVARIGAG